MAQQHRSDRWDAPRPSGCGFPFRLHFNVIVSRAENHKTCLTNLEDDCDARRAPTEDGKTSPSLCDWSCGVSPQEVLPSLLFLGLLIAFGESMSCSLGGLGVVLSPERCIPMSQRSSSARGLSGLCSSTSSYCDVGTISSDDVLVRLLMASLGGTKSRSWLWDDGTTSY